MSAVPEKELKKLCMENGSFCGMCHTDLIIKDYKTNSEKIIAEVAHIRGKKPGSARYDNSMSTEERNSSQNLILLCPDCHTKIDKSPETYTTEKLFEIKVVYEQWVKQRLKTSMVNMTFSELESVTKFLSGGRVTAPDSFTIIPPKDKIRKNGLSSKIEQLITIGMTQVSQVADFINKHPDIDFGDRLKIGFVTEYEQLKNREGLSGDNLFNRLLEFACGNSIEFDRQAAGLAVLVYLFEKCEVFEK